MAKPGPQAMLATWETGCRQSPQERAATLLAYVTGDDLDVARNTDVGTRNVLLARFLTALTQDSLDFCATCRCGERLDVALDLDMIAGWPTHEPGFRLTLQPRDQAPIIRLPTSADLAALEGLGHEEARGRLMARCADGRVTTEVAALIDEALEAACPAAAIGAMVACPTCGSEWEATVDLPALLWAELQYRARALLREVHELALAYGWTETEILALPARRRANYLQLVST
ncbi:MAG TPA: hypothetical protein VIT65_16830 [Microlunatus sp.]